jgi:hypothetical protein
LILTSRSNWVSSAYGRGLAATLAALTFATSVQAAECALTNEAGALRTRVIQSQAMVAALACGEESRYNVFVVKFQKQLVAEGNTLRQFFSRAYGKNATAKLNEFVTAMANRESSLSVADRATYCLRAAELFDGLTAIRPENLADLVGAWPSSDGHGYDVCVRRAQTTAATVPTAPTPAPALR